MKKSKEDIILNVCFCVRCFREEFAQECISGLEAGFLAASRFRQVDFCLVLFCFFFLVWFFYLHQAHHQRLNHNRTVSATAVFLSNLTNKKSSDICLWWWEQNLIRKQMALCGFQEFLINKLILKEVCKKKPKSNNTLVVCIFFFWNWVYTLLNINIKA